MSDRTPQGYPLRPCPFCGGAPTLKQHPNGSYYVRCANDGCHVQPAMTFMFEHLRHAVSAWNTRSASPSEN